MLDWFVKWDQHVKSFTGLIAKEKQACLMSRESVFDLKLCIAGFIQLVLCQLLESSKVHVVPGKLNTNIIENNFCQQRTLYNGANANPDYFQYAKNQNSVILGQSILSNKSNTGGHEAIHPFNFHTPRPLNVRPPRLKSLQ